MSLSAMVRTVCGAVGVCLAAFGPSLGFMNAAVADETRHAYWLEASSNAPLLVYPPEHGTAEPAPLVVLLHGMCGHPEYECPWFAGRATANRFVACPRASIPCSQGGAIWSGVASSRSDLVDRARASVERAFEGKVSRRGNVLVGFSLGAFVALDVASRSRGEWKNLLLIGAKVRPDAHKLREAGVERVLFASGDWDLSRDHMRREARALAARGFRAEYVGMGPVGHGFARDMDAWLARALDWFERAEATS